MFSRLRSVLGRRNGQHEETRVRKNEAGPRSHWNTWRVRWSWGIHRTTGEGPSQISAFSKQEQQMEKLDELTIKQQSIKYEQIELSAILESYTKMDLYNRLNSFEMIKKEHKQVMSDLHKFPLEISNAVNKCKQLMEENNESYSYLHRIGIPDLTQLKNNVHVLRLENKKLLEEQISLQQTCEEAKKLLKEVQEICEPCAEQRQEEESLDERPKNLEKQTDLNTQHRDLAEKMENSFTVLEMRSESKPGGEVLRTTSGNLQSELEPAPAQDESLLQTGLLQQEQEH